MALDLSYNVNLNLSDVFSKSLQIQQGIQQSVQSVLSNGGQSYGRVANTYTGGMNLSPRAFMPPQMQGMFPPIQYNPPAWLSQPWGLQGQLAEQGYYGAPNISAQLARSYNSLPGWLGGATESIIGTLGMAGSFGIGNAILGSSELFGKGFLKKVAEKGLLKAIQGAPAFGFGRLTRLGGALGRAGGELLGGGVLGDVAEGVGTIGGIGLGFEAANLMYYPLTKVADAMIGGISTSVHMYNQAARIGQTFIRPDMFGGRGLTLRENAKLGRALTEQRIGLEEQFPWVSKGVLSSVHEAAIGITMANPMSPFWASRHGGDVTDSFAKAVKDVTDQLIKLGQTTLATTKQLASGMAGLQQIGITGNNVSILKNADILGTVTGQGFDSIMQQTVAAGTRFLGTGIRAQLGANIAQTSIAGTYGAIFQGDIGTQTLSQLGGAQNAAQSVILGNQDFVQSRMGGILLSGMFGANGKLNQNMSGANPMALASATAGAFGNSPSSYLAWMNQRGNMLGQLQGSDVTTTMMSMASMIAGSNNPAAMAGALQMLNPNLSAPQAYAMVASAQNQMQAKETNAVAEANRIGVAQKYAMRSQFKIGSFIGFLAGNANAGAAVEASMYSVGAYMGGTLERAGAAIFNPVLEGYEGLRETYRAATGQISAAELEKLKSESSSSFRIKGLSYTANINGQKIRVSSQADLDYARKHGETQTTHILNEINKPFSTPDQWKKDLGLRTFGDVSGIDLNKESYAGAVWKIFGKPIMQTVQSTEAMTAAEKQVEEIMSPFHKSTFTNVSDVDYIIKHGGAAALGVMRDNGAIIPTRQYSGKVETWYEKNVKLANENLNTIMSKSFTDTVTSGVADMWAKNLESAHMTAAQKATAHKIGVAQLFSHTAGVNANLFEMLSYFGKGSQAETVNKDWTTAFANASPEEQLRMIKVRYHSDRRDMIEYLKEKQGLSTSAAEAYLDYQAANIDQTAKIAQTQAFKAGTTVNNVTPASTQPADKSNESDAYTTAGKRARQLADSLDKLAQMAKS